nr:MAG TPA: hypothetical protein [Caudoviricetes sp.]
MSATAAAASSAALRETRGAIISAAHKVGAASRRTS